MKRFFLIISIFVFAVFGVFAHAQVRNTDIVLSISPEYPGPNQSVRATLNSYVIDLNKANLVWYVNGEEKLNGIGKKVFSFNTDGRSSAMVLSVNIETLEGQNLEKSITINPTEVDLIWEAYDTYSPPFYKGKTLAPSQGKFKVVAIPNIRTSNGLVSPSNLSYTWKQDGNIKPDSSGLGKNYYIFTNTYLDKENVIEVEISDITGNGKTYGKTTLRPTSPKLVFYKKDPVLGTLWENALLDGHIISKDGDILVLEPYFFSPRNINSSGLSFEWKINDAKVTTPNPKNILSIKPDEGKSGSAIINILVDNSKTLFQSAEKKLRIQF